MTLKNKFDACKQKIFSTYFCRSKKFDKTNLKSFRQCYQPLTLSQLALCLWVTHLHCHLACPEKIKINKIKFLKF